jgi:hypothetical protein
MQELKQAIKLQREKLPEIRDHNDFYKITNPIYGYEHIQVILKDQDQINTKIVVDHFNNMSYLKQLDNKEFGIIRGTILSWIIGFVVTIIFFFVILLVTFRYLEVKSLSIIPLFSLIIITCAILTLVINFSRLSVINKVIAGTYKIDHRFLKLCIHRAKKQFENEERNDRSGLFFECGQLSEECTNKKSE